MCVLLAITTEKQEVVEARRCSLGTREWNQATVNKTLTSVNRDFPFNATSVTQHIRRLKRILRLKRIPRLKRKGGAKTALAETGLAVVNAIFHGIMKGTSDSTKTTIRRRIATAIALQEELKGPQQVKQMINRWGKCTYRGQSFILHDNYTLLTFHVFPGRVPCFACYCSEAGKIENCRKCLRSEEITAGKKDEIEECYRDDGKAYRGKVKRTETVDTAGWWEIGSRWRNLRCQAWSAQKPHEHGEYLYKNDYWDPSARFFVPKYTPETDAWAGLEGNFCRNPSGAERPWCYTQSKSTRWAYCDIPKCGSLTTKIAGVKLRRDGRCGPRFLKNGKPAECDPDSENSCCNEQLGVCGNSDEDCLCGDKCVDYWLIRERKAERKRLEKERPLKEGEYWDDLFTIVSTEESIDDVF